MIIDKTLRFILKKTPKQFPITLSSVTGNVNNRNNAFFYHLVRSRATLRNCGGSHSSLVIFSSSLLATQNTIHIVVVQTGQVALSRLYPSMQVHTKTKNA